MRDYSADFGPFGGRVWINAAAEGPMPRVAVQAGHEVMEKKLSPFHIPDSLFVETPKRLKSVLGRLIGAPAEQIILGNSTSYGVHLLANGLPLRSGDEVLLVDGDFPTSILPWLDLRRKGVNVRLLKRPEEVESAITPATKVFCVSWVNSFTGHAIDLEALGRICRANGVAFVVNASQALGARVLDVSLAPVDAVVSCGFKWLCGPYATGFCWTTPELLARLDYNQAYWFTMQGDRPLNEMRNYTLRDDLGAARYDVFCTGNLNNFVPWIASLEYFLDCGTAQIEQYDQALVTRLVEGLDAAAFTCLSPKQGPARSTLVLASHRDPARNPAIYDALTAAGIDIALREGNLRFAPHFYNTPSDVDRALAIVTSHAASS